MIAVNYPAREHGIGRHCTVTEAKKLCPNLICQHVATWKEGEAKWAYHPDAAANMATHKVSLDSYRLESRKILSVIKEQLPAHLQKVEKASIDEVFLDLSANVHAALLERFPKLADPPPYDDPTEHLPMPQVPTLDWRADALVDLDIEDAEMEDPDWDDVAILIGSEIVRDIRAAIRDKLGYTCSGGLANNKMLSKLGSAHKKPNQQTVIRNRAVQHFLSSFKFTKIRNLGGKLGEQISQTFSTETVEGLLPVSIEQLKLKLGDDTGIWVYNTIRGVDLSDVNPRTQIKSMLSAKSFRPDINTFEQAMKWLRIFAADIFSRLVEEGVLENKRRPKSINLHHRSGSQTRSRQAPIPQGRQLDEDILSDLAKGLLNQFIQEGNVWPCSNLSLSVGGFEDGVTGNMGIGAFLVKGEEAKALHQAGTKSSAAKSDMNTARPAEKRRRTDDGGIQRFFMQRETSQGAEGHHASEVASQEKRSAEGSGNLTMRPAPAAFNSDEPDEGQANHQTTTSSSYVCPRCNSGYEDPEEFQSHQDWHFAKDLQDEERVRPVFAEQRDAPASSSRSAAQKGTTSSSKRPGRPKKVERGQSKLKFG